MLTIVEDVGHIDIVDNVGDISFPGRECLLIYRTVAIFTGV